MKRYLALILAVFVIFALFSCDPAVEDTTDKGDDSSENNNGIENGGGSTTKPGVNAPENTIYGYGIRPSIIFNSDDVPDSVTVPEINELNRAIQSVYLIWPSLSSDSSSPSEHEMVFGESNRAITSDARAQLDAKIAEEAASFAEKGIDEDDITGYIIYSNGASLAVYWKDFQISPIAINAFEENYVTESTLLMEPGIAKAELFSLSEYLKEREAALLEEKWAALAEAIPDKYREGIVKELKNLYALYDQDMIKWLANLYDPATGGWYHSNSARDDNNGFSIGTRTVHYLPDIENTYVSLTLVSAMGMAEMFDDDWTKAMPDWLLCDVAEWVQSLQDPDGFFYHPQWPKEFIEAKNLQSRITRDRGSAKELLRRIGYPVKYTAYIPSENSLTEKLGESAVSAVSKVLPTAMLSQYESVENFREYLDGFEAEIAGLGDADRAWKFYYYGNLFQSTTSYMTEDMKRMTIEFFDKYQNPKNGMWSEGLYYDSTNGIHKIAAVYNSIGAELKYIDKIVESTMEIINFDFETRPSSGGVNIYNAWSCFPYIYTNIRNCSNGLTYKESMEKCEEIKAKVFAMAEEAILNTFIHTEGMKQADGSFGYSRSGSSSTAQGCPSAVPGTAEGDVNGNALTSYDIVHYITLALELDDYEIPMFTEEDRNVFVGIIEENREKLRMEVGEDKTYSFEDVSVGDVPDEFTVAIDSHRNEIVGSEIKVAKQDSGNRALEFTMRNRGSDTNGRNYYLTVGATALVEYSRVSKLEMSIMIKSTTDEGSNVCELTFRRATDGSCVILPRLGLSKGTVTMYDTAGNKICDIGKADSFIDLEIVYRFAEKTYDVYVDGVLKGSSSAKYDSKGHSLPASVTIGTASTVNADYLIDNIRFVNYR